MLSASPLASRCLAQHLHDDPVEALVFLPLDGAGAIDAFDQHLDVAVGQLQALDDVGDAAHRVDVFRARVVHRGVVLRGKEDALVLEQRVLQRARRARPPDDERHHHVREDDDVSERDDRKGFVDFQMDSMRSVDFRSDWVTSEIRCLHFASAIPTLIRPSR